jgi:hypothetical protein
MTTGGKTAKERITDTNTRAACPLKLFTDDGRELGVLSWESRIAVGEDVTVTITARVMHRKSNDLPP